MSRATVREKIVIIGGGYAGVRAATVLSRYVPRGYEVVLIDRTNEHVLKPRLIDLATAETIGSMRGQYEAARAATTVSLADICARLHVTFIRADVQTVLFREKRVVLRDGGKIPFAYVLLASGAETNFFAIPGVVEGARPLRTPDDAMMIRMQIEELFAAPGKQTVSLVIGGGGFLGVELAGHFAKLGQQMVGRRGNKKRCTVTLIEAGPQILPGASEWLVRRVMRKLSRIGVKVMQSSRVAKFDGTKVHVQGGASVPTSLFVWTGGIRPTELAQSVPGPSAKGKFVLTNLLGQTTVSPRVFAIGDIAQIKKGEAASIPRSVFQGEVAAHGIIDDIVGVPIHQKKFVSHSFIVGLGGWYGVAEIGGVRLAGFPGFAARRIADLRYVVHIMPFYKAIRMWLRGSI